MDKVYFVVTIARQVEGEYVTVRFEKAFREEDKAKEYADKLSKVFTETINVPNVGAIEFVCERGWYQLNVEN